MLCKALALVFKGLKQCNVSATSYRAGLAERMLKALRRSHLMPALILRAAFSPNDMLFA